MAALALLQYVSPPGRYQRVEAGGPLKRSGSQRGAAYRTDDDFNFHFCSPSTVCRFARQNSVKPASQKVTPEEQGR